MRFPAKKNAGCPKAPCDFPPRKDGILCPRRVVLGLPSTSHRVRGWTDVRMYGCADVRMYGRTDVRTDGHVTITSQPKFLGLIGYHISLAMELRWRALPAGSAIKIGIKAKCLGNFIHPGLDRQRCYIVVSSFFRGVACDFAAVRTLRREKYERRRRFPLGGSGGMLPPKISKFRISEMAFPAFSGGHFQ